MVKPLAIKIAIVTGYLTAVFISYVANNAAFEDKRRVWVFNPHKHLGLYVVDIAMTVVPALIMR